MVYSQDFYIGEVIRGGSRTKPYDLRIMNSARGDSFYTKREVGYAFWTGVGAVVVLLGVVAAAIGGVDIESSDDDGNDY